MKQKTRSLAFAGILTALSVVVMLLSGVIPLLTYISPLFTGLITLLTLTLCGRKWAISGFFAVSALSLMLVSDKEAVLLYLLFFGYYPLLKKPIARLARPVRVVMKLLLFNGAMLLSGVLMVWLFGADIAAYRSFGNWTIPVLLLLGNLLLLLYDISLSKYAVLFLRFADRLKKRRF